MFGIIIPPPGYNLDTMTGQIAKEIESAIHSNPIGRTVAGPESEPGQPPKIERFFFVATRSNTFVGAISVEPQRAAELIPVLQGRLFQEPGTFGFINQPSLFGRSASAAGGRSSSTSPANDLEDAS